MGKQPTKNKKIAPTVVFKYKNRSVQRGFTLIELMVVVVIVGIIISMSSLSVNLNTDQSLDKEARRIEALTRLAVEEAIFNSRDILFRLAKNGYDFALITDQGIQPFDEEDAVFRARELPSGLSLRAIINGEEVSLQVDAGSASSTENPEEAEKNKYQHSIPILSSGDVVPFELYVENDDGGSRGVASDYLGNVQYVGKPDENR
ncbi:MAG: prepilin-type N-terminal cleavage/methylation domain-containing protein [Gammaproteobacteria bacterium]|nr:prepilin-type N-terminal cleavage/methylation domain-containing protein [Gammaproteobacteria bacterium]